MLRAGTERFATAAVNIRPRMCCSTTCQATRRHCSRKPSHIGHFPPSIMIVLQNAPITARRHVNSSDASCHIDSAKVVRDVVQLLRLQLLESRTCHFLNYKHRPLETVGTDTDTFLFFFFLETDTFISFFLFDMSLSLEAWHKLSGAKKAPDFV